MHVFFAQSALPEKNLSRFDMLEFSLLDHSHYSKGDGALVIKSSEQLLHQLRVGDTGADGHSASDSFFNACAQYSKLIRCVLSLACHARCSSVQGGDLE